MEKSHNNHSIKKKKHKYLTPQNSPLKSVSLKNSLITNSELLKFISSGLKNKINFTSVFDHKGCKKFLQSKNIALQEILVNDEEIESNKKNKENEKIIQIYGINEFSNKRKSEEKKNYSKNFLTPEKLYKCQNENSKTNKSKDKKKEKSIKNKIKIKKPMTNKFLWSYKICDINDELSKHKNGKIAKTRNTYEIKMFKDKDIKNIEPIKKAKQNKSNKECYNFVKIDSEENDLSLFDMINQL